MQYSQFWNNFVDSQKFAIIEYPDTSGTSTGDVLSLAWVRSYHDGIVSLDIWRHDCGFKKDAVPVSEIKRMLPLPISSLIKANPPESNFLTGGKMGTVSSSQGESVESYFGRFVAPFIASQSIQALWEANQKEVMTGPIV